MPSSHFQKSKQASLEADIEKAKEDAVAYKKMVRLATVIHHIIRNQTTLRPLGNHLVSVSFSSIIKDEELFLKLIFFIQNDRYVPVGICVQCNECFR